MYFRRHSATVAPLLVTMVTMVTMQVHLLLFIFMYDAGGGSKRETRRGCIPFDADGLDISSRACPHIQYYKSLQLPNIIFSSYSLPLSLLLCTRRSVLPACVLTDYNDSAWRRLNVPHMIAFAKICPCVVGRPRAGSGPLFLFELVATQSLLVLPYSP